MSPGTVHTGNEPESLRPHIATTETLPKNATDYDVGNSTAYKMAKLTALAVDVLHLPLDRVEVVKTTVVGLALLEQQTALMEQAEVNSVIAQGNAALSFLAERGRTTRARTRMGTLLARARRLAKLSTYYAWIAAAPQQVVTTYKITPQNDTEIERIRTVSCWGRGTILGRKRSATISWRERTSHVQTGHVLACSACDMVRHRRNVCVVVHAVWGDVSRV